MIKLHGRLLGCRFPWVSVILPLKTLKQSKTGLPVEKRCCVFSFGLCKEIALSVVGKGMRRKMTQDFMMLQ